MKEREQRRGMQSTQRLNLDLARKEEILICAHLTVTAASKIFSFNLNA